MTVGATLQLPPIPTMVDNPGDWGSIIQEVASASGSPPPVTLEMLTGLVASAVPLLFEADASRTSDLLRGTFTDPVIAQCQRNIGCLNGEHPLSSVVHLVGAPVGSGQPVVRVHIMVDVQSPDGSSSINSQFWDLAIGVQVAVGQTTCPNCGAPLGPGQLICDHCRTDVRSAVQVPLAVSRLELY
jgi:hypothetical protein